MRGLLVNLALLFAALLVATSPAVAADPASGARVDASNFDAIVAASDAAFVVKVHSPRCGTCQEMRPTWDALVAARSNDVKFATVDIDDDRGMKLAVELGVLDDGGVTRGLGVRSRGGGRTIDAEETKVMVWVRRAVGARARRGDLRGRLRGFERREDRGRVRREGVTIDEINDAFPSFSRRR